MSKLALRQVASTSGNGLSTGALRAVLEDQAAVRADWRRSIEEQQKRCDERILALEQRALRLEARLAECEQRGL